MMKSINQNSGDSIKSENNNTKLAANVSQRAIAAKDDDAAPRAFGSSSSSCASDSNIGWDWAKFLPTREECVKELWPKMKRAEERLKIRLSKKAIEEDRMLECEEEPVVEQAVEPATVATEATPAQRSLGVLSALELILEMRGEKPAVVKSEQVIQLDAGQAGAKAAA